MIDVILELKKYSDVLKRIFRECTVHENGIITGIPIDTIIKSGSVSIIPDIPKLHHYTFNPKELCDIKGIKTYTITYSDHNDIILHVPDKYSHLNDYIIKYTPDIKPDPSDLFDFSNSIYTINISDEDIDILKTNDVALLKNFNGLQLPIIKAMIPSWRLTTKYDMRIRIDFFENISHVSLKTMVISVDTGDESVHYHIYTLLSP